MCVCVWSHTRCSRGSLLLVGSFASLSLSCSKKERERERESSYTRSLSLSSSAAGCLVQYELNTKLNSSSCSVYTEKQGIAWPGHRSLFPFACSHSPSSNSRVFCVWFFFSLSLSFSPLVRSLRVIFVSSLVHFTCYVYSSLVH